MGKIRNTELLGAGVVGQGDGLDEAYALARDTAARDGSTLVHPYDDERIVAGQGTVGLEILGEDRHFDAVVVPIGGGGLISGLAVAVKSLRPETAVVGVDRKSVGEGTSVSRRGRLGGRRVHKKKKK